MPPGEVTSWISTAARTGRRKEEEREGEAGSSGTHSAGDRPVGRAGPRCAAAWARTPACTDASGGGQVPRHRGPSVEDSRAAAIISSSVTDWRMSGQASMSSTERPEVSPCP